MSKILHRRVDEDEYRVTPWAESRRLVQGGQGHVGKITSEQDRRTNQ